MKKLLLLLLIVPMISFGQCISGDCENGYGSYHARDGSWMYTGEFKNGKRHGLGQYLWLDDGKYYKGEWKYGKRHGYGIYVISGGDSWSGEWKDSEANGLVTYKKSDGTGSLSYYVDNKVVKTICKF